MSDTNFLFFGKKQFIYDLPARLAKCIKSEAYADAVKYYTGAMPIFKVCSDPWVHIFILFMISLHLKILVLLMLLICTRLMGTLHSRTANEPQKKQSLSLLKPCRSVSDPISWLGVASLFGGGSCSVCIIPMHQVDPCDYF